MCFSASASFGASAILAGVGIIAIKRIESPKVLAFASIPILFSVQQLSEGILWLTFLNPELVSWQNTSIYFFLLFAEVIWPIWIPFAVWLMEPDKARKKMISYLILIGAASSVHLIYCLFAYEASAFIEASHIRYYINIPYLGLHHIFYFLAAVVPLFLSSLRLMKLLGAAVVGSLILSFIFFFHFVTSVWCFFAAILSVLILFIIIYNKESY